MNQPNKMTPNPQPVSTVTKHIKIYSDNPIHDCIDRIIDACSRIDEGNDISTNSEAMLQRAADELLWLADAIYKEKCYELGIEPYEKVPN
jgi:hypothetical protein